MVVPTCRRLVLSGVGGAAVYPRTYEQLSPPLYAAVIDAAADSQNTQVMNKLNGTGANDVLG